MRAAAANRAMSGDLGQSAALVSRHKPDAEENFRKRTLRMEKFLF